MGRPRTTNTHLPKYVKPIHGSLWYCLPKVKPVRICKIGDDAALWKFMLDRAEPTGPILYMTDLFDRYEKEVLPTLAPRTQKDYRRMIVKLREVFGPMRPNDVKPKDVGNLVVFGPGGAQSVKLVAVLSAVFSKAVGRWYVCDRNPCHKVEKPEAGKRDRYITDEEYKAVYDLMPARVQIAMDLALLTGQRQGDILSLTWDKVTSQGIRFRQGKTGKRLIVEMSPALESVLKRARMMLPQVPRTYVVRTGPSTKFKRHGGKPYTSDGFRALWQRGMNKAVRGYWKGSRSTRRWVEPILKDRFTFHDIRAKTVSDTQDLNEAMKRAGHTSMAMTRGVYDRGERPVKPLK